MQFEFVTRTDTGLLRKNNEDAISVDAAAGVAVLADGMGGYNAGEIASNMAATFICRELTAWMQTRSDPVVSADVARAVRLAIANANTAVLNSALSNPNFAGMGTTLVVWVWHGTGCTIGHIGDSRCYLWRAGSLRRLTKDHSLLQEHIDAGLMTPLEAETATIRNLVTRALGVAEEVDIELAHCQPEIGDVYLLCSDGLTDMVSDLQIARILETDADLAQKATSLVAIANAEGGRDNISVLLAQSNALTQSQGIIARLWRK
ncbi:Stp1/IreP family PP2C-type Ser/Thr phosphatase [Curvibacter sp. CHRR-16]|uniref:Stp1/IreP family PP2C-type Ser/Thr phosphatase n=1 Tax=Curvibacter sp. CHRR-16 TaxID=2835872 RepID=UPI001BDA023A|nr:Stp1/IreP family PP2C-type Ser/Thr phosphatase [Curvibacter sp. CHRR-16]MBT0570413.1 Stp1/IreP family PP2C-type Ser/Thr phosphatase [Curvibacter sp. CHRR-16]